MSRLQRCQRTLGTCCCNGQKTAEAEAVRASIGVGTVFELVTEWSHPHLRFLRHMGRTEMGEKWQMKINNRIWDFMALKSSPIADLDLPGRN